MVISIDETSGKPASVNSGEMQSTHIVFLLDETGSMSVIKEKTINGFNEYIQTMKAKAQNMSFTLIRFNSISGAKEMPTADIGGIPELTTESYQPNGGTPLYDALGAAINCGDAHKAEKTLIVIQTDGEENASKELTLEALKGMIKEREAKGWTFVCMGANMDAWSKIGSTLGLAKGNVMNYAGSNSGDAFAALSRSSVTYGCSRGTTKSFWRQ